MLIDLRTSRVFGRVSEKLAADTKYWQTVIFPMLLTIISASVGVAELHCACVAYNEYGLLLAGPSGAGKSTLTLALALAGFSILSDDRTFCSVVDGQVHAWSLPTLLKLRPDAVQFFEEFRDKELEDTRSGGPAYWLQPEEVAGATRSRQCQPIAVIFLERTERSESQWLQLSSADALSRLDSELMAESPTALTKRLETIKKVVTLPCWLLRYGKGPHLVAREIAEQFSISDHRSLSAKTETAIRNFTKRTPGSTPHGDIQQSPNQVETGRVHDDPIRRFLPTPYSTFLSMMGRTVRLETNHPRLLHFMNDLFACYPKSASQVPAFVWRIVVESSRESLRYLPRRSAFSDVGLRYVEFGQRNFLATDLETRRAIAIVSESLMNDPIGFTTPFLDSLFCLTAGSLGLASLWANCVVGDEKGVLVFGEANSGKTSASYLAARLGLNFQGDDGAFLDLDGGALHVWGGFWPATFRPKALEFFPELQEGTRELVHQDFVLHHLHEVGPLKRRPFQPLCCLFLERHSCLDPVLSRISANEASRRLEGSILFRDDDRFAEREAAILGVLAELPAYRLQYGDNPAVAARTVRDLLTARNLAAFDCQPAVLGGTARVSAQ